LVSQGDTLPSPGSYVDIQAGTITVGDAMGEEPGPSQPAL
jgi:hypothetical protein